jgi:hypothetical protein
MEPRFEDLRDTDARPCTLIGGTTEADIWLSVVTDGYVRGKNLPVLICQYEGTDNYVSYYPPGAILEHVKGTLMDIPQSGFLNRCITKWPEGTRTYWKSGEMEHNALEIARYVAVFAPYVFTEDERNEALGMSLTTMEK